MVAHDHDPIRFAIESAQRERDKLLEKLKEFEKIKERLSQIEAFINQGRILIGDKPENIGMDKPESRAGRIIRFLGEKTNADKVIGILEASGRAMRVPEIANEFRVRNWPLSEKNGMQILRNVLKGKPDLFVKVGIGTWDLKERAT